MTPRIDKWFPILITHEERRNLLRVSEVNGQPPRLHEAELLSPLHVPWAMLTPHEKQAMLNHGGQSLQEIAARGGLGPDEMIAILDDRKWTPMPLSEALDEVYRRAAAWTQALWNAEASKGDTPCIVCLVRKSVGHILCRECRADLVKSGADTMQASLVTWAANRARTFHAAPATAPENCQKHPALAAGRAIGYLIRVLKSLRRPTAAERAIAVGTAIGAELEKGLNKPPDPAEVQAIRDAMGPTLRSLVDDGLLNDEELQSVLLGDRLIEHEGAVYRWRPSRSRHLAIKELLRRAKESFDRVMELLPRCWCGAPATYTRFDAAGDTQPSCKEHATVGGMLGDSQPMERKWMTHLTELGLELEGLQGLVYVPEAGVVAQSRVTSGKTEPSSGD